MTLVLCRIEFDLSMPLIYQENLVKQKYFKVKAR